MVTSHIFGSRHMRISILILGIAVTSLGISQGTENKAVMTRVYDGNDFETYYLDPPCWIYLSRGFWHTKSAHWLYKNHRYVFIDIKLN
jgi:hypothetical protein